MTQSAALPRRGSRALRRLTRVTSNESCAILLLVEAIDSIGTGLYLAGSAMFFTQVVGLSAAGVGLGLSLGGLLGLIGQPVIGWLADRHGPRQVLVWVNLWRAAGFAAFVFTDDLLTFIIVAALLGIGDHAVYPIHQALVERVAGVSDRLRVMAQVRVVANVGITAGALLASVAVSTGARPALVTIMLGNALTFIVAAALLPRVEMSPEPVRESREPFRLRALRDRWYGAVAALNGVLSLHMVLLGIAMPLWVILHTSAPRALVGVLLVTNTAIAVCLQARATRSTESLQGAVAALRRAAVALAFSCGLFAIAPRWDAPALVILTLLLAVIALTAAELYQSAGGWSLSYALAPDHSRAEYLATFSLGTSAQLVVGPALVTAGVVGHGLLGWLVLAGCFLLAGAGTRSIVSRAAARAAYGAGRLDAPSRARVSLGSAPADPESDALGHMLAGPP